MPRRTNLIGRPFIVIWNVYVRLECPTTTNVTGPAVEATTQRIGMADANSHCVKAKILEHFDGGRLIGVNADTFRA